MGLCLFSKHTVSVCTWAVLVRLVSVFSVKASARTTQSHLGKAFWAVAKGGAERLWLVWLSRGGKSGALPQKEWELSPCLYPYLQGGWRTQTGPYMHLTSPITMCWDQCLVLAPVFWPQWPRFPEWTPMLWISATLFLSLSISLTHRPAIPTSYKGHWEAAAHTGKSFALLLWFFFLSCSQAAGNPQRKSQNESEKFKWNVFSSSAMGPPGLHGRTFALCSSLSHSAESWF